LERNDIQDARNLVSGASFYIYINGSVGAFGINNFGQLGLGDKQRRQKPGILLSLGQNIIDIAGCVYATYALTKDGLVYAFGDNTQGYLGQGDTIARLTPILIPSLTNVSVISAGVVSGHFLTSDGRMWSVGTCSYGDFGIGIDFADYYVPVMAIFPPNVFLTQISSGGRHIIALTNESLVYSFGYNIGGQLGLGILNVSCSTPQSVPIANVASVGTGDLTSYFFKKNGEVWSVGSNPLGELGLGDYISRSTPQKVLIPTPMNFIAPGSACVAWNLKGEAWYWGSNQQGQLGLTDVNGRSTPFLHPLLSIYKIEKAKNGYINTILFTKDKIILIGNIGSDNSVPSIASGLFGSTIKVGAAFQHSVSLQGDSSLLASGLNTNGQVIGTDRLNRIIPIRIRLDVAPNIQDICTSMRNNLILTKNGQVFAYGSNDKGQSGMDNLIPSMF
jgi:alpha-tubulin suppressor-like RCC1 family protein